MEAHSVVIRCSIFNVVLEAKTYALVLTASFVVWTFDIVLKLCQISEGCHLVLGKAKLCNFTRSLNFCQLRYKRAQLVCYIRLLPYDSNLRRALLWSIVIRG